VTNVLLALVWVTTGALSVGVAAAVSGPRRGLPRRLLAWCLSLGLLLVSCAWLVLPISAFSRTIDIAQPTQIECGSAWGSLHDGFPYIYTDEGRQYELGFGECQAAAWHRVASLGTAEVGVAVVLGVASSVVRRRRPTARDAQPAASF
jgi:hypothetical protein